MSTVQRVAKNTAFLYASYIVAGLLSFFISIYIARQLGDVTFGRYSFAGSFAAIFAIFISLGFPTLIVRAVARDKSLASKYLGNIAVIQAILSVIIFGLLALTINLMHYPRDTTIAVLILGIYNIFISFAGIFYVTFRAYERMEYVALCSIVRSVLTVSLSLAAILLGYGLIGIVCALLIGSVFDLLLSFLICRQKFARPKLEIDLDLWKQIARVALPLSVGPIASIIFIRIDTVILSAMKGDAVVGWYNAAYTLVLALKPIPLLFGQALFPAMAVFFISSRDSLKVSYEKSLRYLLILGLPIAVGTTLLAGRIIPLFYGEQFSNSIGALQILAWDILLFFLYYTLGNTLIAMNRQNQWAAAAVGCAVINLILNLILIPRFSYIGAGIATIAAETFLFGVSFYFVSRYLYRLPFHKIIAKPLIACSGMALFIYFCGGLNLAALIISAALLYFVVLYLIKGFTREDRELIGRIFLRRAKGDGQKGGTSEK